MHIGEHLPLSRRPAHASRPGRHRQPGDQPVTCRDVFAIGEFRALWSAQALSCAGDQIAQVAIAFVVYARTGSAFLTAAAYALTYLPPVIGGAALSGLADLFPRQQMMIALDLIRAGLVALMALPGLPFAGLCTLFFGTVLLGTPFSAARSALLPDVLPGGKYPLGSVIGSHTTQLSQIAGFLAGGALIACFGPYRALALDSLSFSLSAGILACGLRSRPAPRRRAGDASPWEITWDGVTAVFGTPALRTLVLFGWLAGFTVVPEALAAPYARELGGGAPAIGLLMAAMPAGTVIGGFVIGHLLRPSDRMRPMGWLAMLSCAPLIFSLAHPRLPVLILLLALAGAGGAYQLAAAAAFVTALPAARRIRAFAVAQTGLLAAQGLGIVTGGAVAQRVGRAWGGRPGRARGPAGRSGPGHRLEPPARRADQHAAQRTGRRRARRDRHRARRNRQPRRRSPPRRRPPRRASPRHRRLPQDLTPPWPGAAAAGQPAGLRMTCPCAAG